MLSNIFISCNPICLCVRDRAFNWWPAFWHSAVTFFSKFSLLSISMNNSVMEFSESILWLSIKRSCEFFNFSRLLIILDWNLSGFTTISFEKNQSMAFSDYFWSIIKSSILFEKVAIVLSLYVFYEIRQVIYKNVEVQ